MASSSSMLLLSLLACMLALAPTACHATGRALAAAATPAATSSAATSSTTCNPVGVDYNILNFALNLEYLEANFYSCMAFGVPINSSLWGTGPFPEGCKQPRARLSDQAQAFAAALARDEQNHVNLLRTTLGPFAINMPLIDVGAFSTIVDAAFGSVLSPAFAAYADDILFYSAAFFLEDLGVSAYLGAIPSLTCTPYVNAANGVMAVEAYHAGTIRALLLTQIQQYIFPYDVDVDFMTSALAQYRAKQSGVADDAGLLNVAGQYILAPADANGIAYQRVTSQVLNILYEGGSSMGGFFPNGVNGAITTTQR